MSRPGTHLQQPGELGLPVGHVARLVGGERLDHLPQTRQRQVDALKVSILRPQRGVINHLISVVKVKVARKVQVGLQMLTSKIKIYSAMHNAIVVHARYRLHRAKVLSKRDYVVDLSR